MSRFFSATRCLIIIPIIGLGLAGLGLFPGLRTLATRQERSANRSDDQVLRNTSGDVSAGE